MEIRKKARGGAAVLAALMLCLVAIPSFAFADSAQTENADALTVETDDGSVLKWAKDGENAKITGWVSLTPNLIIPESIEGRSVIAIADQAVGSDLIPNSTFANCTQLESVYIPDSVKLLSGMDFYECVNLRTVRMSPNIVNFGIGEFAGCESLQSIELPQDLRILEESCFTGCTSLSSIRIPAQVRSIGAGAFGACSALKSLTFVDTKSASGLTIGAGAFNGCALEKVSLPAGTTAVSANAFRECTNLSVCYIPNSVSSIDDNAFDRGTVILTDVDAPSVRKWAKRVGAVYIAGNLNDYYKVSNISPVSYSGKEQTPLFLSSQC